MLEDNNVALSLPSERHRLCYYLGPCYDQHREYDRPTQFIADPKYRKNITADSRIKVVDYIQLSQLKDDSVKWKIQERMLLKALKEECFCSDLFALVRGDTSPDRPILDFPFFCKVRSQPHQPAVLLRLLKFSRHWQHFYRYHSSFSKTFDQKIDKLFWRGATTGKPGIPGNRFKLVRDYFNSDPLLDVGYNVICHGHDDLSVYQKSNVDIPEFADYKYLLSIPGNDKDSGLAWKLASRSVVLMPRPVISSWLMEKLLVPGYHYVELREDFSNLIQVLNWCQMNQQSCFQIAENARCFMSQFLDEVNEVSIERKVLREYFRAFELA